VSQTPAVGKGVVHLKGNAIPVTYPRPRLVRDEGLYAAVQTRTLYMTGVNLI